jgi:hypothetical protein
MAGEDEVNPMFQEDPCTTVEHPVSSLGSAQVHDAADALEALLAR